MLLARLPELQLAYVTAASERRQVDPHGSYHAELGTVLIFFVALPVVLFVKSGAIFLVTFVFEGTADERLF